MLFDWEELLPPIASPCLALWIITVAGKVAAESDVPCE